MIDDDPLELSRDIELPLTLKEIARTSSLNCELKMPLYPMAMKNSSRNLGSLAEFGVSDSCGLSDVRGSGG